MFKKKPKKATRIHICEEGKKAPFVKTLTPVLPYVINM